jgi:hypothetical protein
VCRFLLRTRAEDKHFLRSHRFACTSALPIVPGTEDHSCPFAVDSVCIYALSAGANVSMRRQLLLQLVGQLLNVRSLAESLHLLGIRFTVDSGVLAKLVQHLQRGGQFLFG